MLSSFDRTDDLLLLCGTDVPTIKNVRMGMQTLQLLTFPKDRIRLVLNRANTKGGINRGEIERALESKVRFELPADPAVTLAVNQGKPVVLSNAKAPFSQAIRQLANALAGGEAAAKHRPRLLARARA